VAFAQTDKALHNPVDILLTRFHVGSPQRPKNKHWRGFPVGPFDYNESPTSSCQTFCWKARQAFDVPFFCLSPGCIAALNFAARG
jgi:hypothetical protein